MTINCLKNIQVITELAQKLLFKDILSERYREKIVHVFVRRMSIFTLLCKCNKIQSQPDRRVTILWSVLSPPGTAPWAEDVMLGMVPQGWGRNVFFVNDVYYYLRERLSELDQTMNRRIIAVR